MRNKQNGFAVTHIVLFIVIISLVGGVGYYVFKRNKTPLSHQSSQETSEQALPQTLGDLKSLDEITTAASSQIGSLGIVSVKLEQDGGRLVYKVKLSNGTVLIFDAKTGQSVATKTEEDDEGDDDMPANFAAAISFEDARQIAQERRPGKTIKEIKLENDGGIVVYKVEFIGADEVRINATSGAVVKDDEEKDAEDKDDDQEEDRDEDDSEDSDEDSQDQDEDESEDEDEPEDEDDSEDSDDNSGSNDDEEDDN